MAHSRSNGSHYALTAIGLGMLVLGIVMAVWNLAPGFGFPAKPHAVGNGSKTDPGGETSPKNKTVSVAYVLVGAGALLLLFSVCLSVRDRRKQRQDGDLSRIRRQISTERPPQEESQEDDEETLSRYYVPSYEEVVNANPPGPSDADRGAPINVSLPSYESLTGIDETAPTRPQNDGNPERQPNRHGSRLGKRPKPLKVRRIESEKLHLKDLRVGLPEGNVSGRIAIEPLTPPPRYDEISGEKPEREGES